MPISTIRVDAKTKDGSTVHGRLTGNGAGKYTGIETDDGERIAVLKESVTLFLSSNRGIDGKSPSMTTLNN